MNQISFLDEVFILSSFHFGKLSKFLHIVFLYFSIPPCFFSEFHLSNFEIFIFLPLASSKIIHIVKYFLSPIFPESILNLFHIFKLVFSIFFRNFIPENLFLISFFSHIFISIKKAIFYAITSLCC